MTANVRRLNKMAEKVPFDTRTVSQCLCPGCPVQIDSQCVATQRAGLQEVLSSGSLKHEEVPGAYCGADKAACSDLNPSQSCLCTGCPVFGEYHLEAAQPEGYYCQAGAAH